MKIYAFIIFILLLSTNFVYADELPSLIVFNIGAEEGVSKGKANMLTEILIDEVTKLNQFPALLTPQVQFLITNNKYVSGSFSIVAFSTQQFELLTLGLAYTKSPEEGGTGIAFNLYRMNIALHTITKNNDTHLFIGFIDGYTGGNNTVVSLISLGLGWGFYMY